jgi:hypothetical protein
MIQLIKSPTTPDYAFKRNRQLFELFENFLGPNRVRLIGKADAPSIVVDNKFSVAAYVHNFDLYFQADWQGGAPTMYAAKLSANNFHIAEEDFFDWLNKANHREMFYVQLADTPLYLSGSNYTDPELKNGMYPVFSSIGFKLYFSKGFAYDKISELEANPFCAGMKFNIL